MPSSIQAVYGPFGSKRGIEPFQAIDVKTPTNHGRLGTDIFISDIKPMASVSAALGEVEGVAGRVRCHLKTAESQNHRLNLQMMVIKGNIAYFQLFITTVVPMLTRLAPLVPIALVTLLYGCAAQSPVSQQQASAPVTAQSSVHAQSQTQGHGRQALASSSVFEDEIATENELARFSDNQSYKMPALADSILERGKSLIGTRYRTGGSTESGFDCSGFIGYLFREEAGMTLPRSTREMINVKAPLVARNNLKPGDLLFFSTRGRGRVSHAGIYLGDDQFIHSSSHRSGGVRIDSLDDSYWSKTFIEAKRALAMAPTNDTVISRK